MCQAVAGCVSGLVSVFNRQDRDSKPWCEWGVPTCTLIFLLRAALPPNGGEKSQSKLRFLLIPRLLLVLQLGSRSTI